MRTEAERGQTFVVACLTVLILSLATLTTVAVGHTIHERIGLQNAADAAAYSTAAMEARAFNFYAFANRAQASHYVSAMAWQSLDSFIYFAEAFLTDFYGFLRTVDVCSAVPTGPWIGLCPMLFATLAPLMQIVHALVGIVREVLKAYQQLLSSTNPDSVIGRQIVPTHWALNSLMAAASSAMLKSVLESVTSSSSAVITANDPQAVASSASGQLSGCLFERTHYDGALGPPNKPLAPDAVDDSSKVARAKRVMGTIANGTRFSCNGPGCTSTFVTQRTDARVLPFGSLLKGSKVGQTRLLTTRYADGQGTADKRHLNYIRDWRDPPGYGIGQLAQPDNLGSDDVYWMRFGRLGPWGDGNKGRREPGDGALDQPYRYTVKTSIWALNATEGIPGGVHWRVEYGGSSCAGPECPWGVTQTSRGAVELFKANVQPVKDGNHDWRGTAPFPHFEPGQFLAACGGLASTSAAATQAEEFNQPSVWVTLTKSLSAQPALLSPQGRLGSLTMRDRSLLNAMSRAQTYYHRPGNWNEQPNFFNPYWRPRLASVYQGRAAMPLDAFQPGIALPKVFTH